MNSDIKKMIAAIDQKIVEMKKQKFYSEEIAELNILRELLMEQIPYEDFDKSTR